MGARALSGKALHSRKISRNHHLWRQGARRSADLVEDKLATKISPAGAAPKDAMADGFRGACPELPSLLFGGEKGVDGTEPLRCHSGAGRQDLAAAQAAGHLS